MRSNLRYLLDTDTCIYVVNRQPPQVVQRLLQMEPNNVGISAITGAELQFGAENSSSQRGKAALAMFLTPLTIVPFGREAMMEYGRLRYFLKSKGTPIGPMDTLIAAHALACDLTLVTNNVREFSRVPKLKIENWVGG